MFKVVGLKKQEGIYNGREYKNYLLYVIPTKKDEMEVFGVCPEKIKIKQDYISSLGVDVADLYQQEVQIYFDSYRNVAKIDIVNS